MKAKQLVTASTMTTLMPPRDIGRITPQQLIFG
jgi:hypothetical protein